MEAKRAATVQAGGRPAVEGGFAATVEAGRRAAGETKRTAAVEAGRAATVRAVESIRSIARFAEKAAAVIAHLVLFRLKPGLPDEARQGLLDALTRATREIPSLRRARIGS